MANRTKPELCIFDGCDGPANVPGTAKGFCRMHYGRLWRHGDPSVVLINVHNEPVCSVGGCDRKHVAKGLCGYHYAQHRDAKQDACSVPSCDLLVKCRGWCQGHYTRWKKTGDVQAHVPIWTQIAAGTSWCSFCQQVKATGEFPANKGRHRGVHTYCSACTTVVRRERYRVNIYAQQKRWRVANPERVAEYGRVWAANNPEKLRAKHARQKAADPERYWRYARAGEQNRRAREKAAPGRATSAQISARWAYFGHNCWMCGAPADVTDHVKPLSKGGSNWASNLRPACRRCNNSKRAKWPFPLEVVRARRASGRKAA